MSLRAAKRNGIIASSDERSKATAGRRDLLPFYDVNYSVFDSLCECSLSTRKQHEISFRAQAYSL
jgi:hypothetical protein